MEKDYIVRFYKNDDEVAKSTFYIKYNEEYLVIDYDFTDPIEFSGILNTITAREILQDAISDFIYEYEFINIEEDFELAIYIDDNDYEIII